MLGNYETGCTSKYIMNLNGAFFSKSTSLEAPKLITKVIFSPISIPKPKFKGKGGSTLGAAGEGGEEGLGVTVSL